MPIELLLALSGLAAGTFGAMLGLGGGILIVPILTFGFGVPLTEAIGTSLICVVATSTGAAAINVRARRTDLRLGITLAGGTVVGAVTGAILAGHLPERVLAGLFAALFAYTTATMVRGIIRPAPRSAREGAGDPTVADGTAEPAYRARRVRWAIGGSVLAGNASGLLGVGGGIVIVPIVHLVMGAPMRVAVATSTFMAGMTAAAGSYAYLFRGDVDARLTAPVVIGVAIGAAIGAVLSGRLNVRILGAIFVVVVGYVAVRMALRALA
jgi:uncharacterized protein